MLEDEGSHSVQVVASDGFGGARVWHAESKTWHEAPGANFNLAFASEGNFIVRRGTSPVFVWDHETSAWTQGPPGTVEVLRGSNGHLLAFGPGGARVWNAVTKGWHEAPGANFNLADEAEGNFIVRRGDGPAFVWKSANSTWQESPPGTIDSLLGTTERQHCVGE